MATVRILLVEDFEPFRRVVRALLQSRTDLEIVAEAVDGVEAVEKAKLLKPDLILLDIGLPKRNGISAARQIAVDSPGSKLLFVSLEASPETVKTAVSIGAQGYIHKLTIDADLLPAIDAVVAGRQYISREIDPGTAEEQPRHEVLFYSEDSVFLEHGARFIRGALEAGGAVVAIVTAAHKQSLVRRLESEGFDVNRALREERYASLDVDEFLSKVMVNGMPDFQRFSTVLGGVMNSALKARKNEHSRIAILGECSGALCTEGNFDGALEMETFDTGDNDVLCTYPRQAFKQTDGNPVYEAICEAHTAVLS